MESDGEQLEKLAEIVEAGALKPQIDSIFPLSKVPEAFAKSETGHAQGKIIIEVCGV